MNTLPDHLTAAEVEQFILGTLPEGRLAAFEAHVSECKVCERSLAGEARFEEAVIEVAAAVRRRYEP